MEGENYVIRRFVVHSTTQYSGNKIIVDEVFFFRSTHLGDENTYTHTHTPFKKENLKRITRLVYFSITGMLMLDWVSKP